MPTKREREYYAMGFRDGQKQANPPSFFDFSKSPVVEREYTGIHETTYRKPKRKLSAWNKFVKANSKKPRFRYRNGKLNLKKMAVSFRKTPAGRKRKK